LGYNFRREPLHSFWQQASAEVLDKSFRQRCSAGDFVEDRGRILQQTISVKDIGKTLQHQWSTKSPTVICGKDDRQESTRTIIGKRVPLESSADDFGRQIRQRTSAKDSAKKCFLQHILRQYELPPKHP